MGSTEKELQNKIAELEKRLSTTEKVCYFLSQIILQDVDAKSEFYDDMKHLVGDELEYHDSICDFLREKYYKK